jgi:hypothetical protein
MGQGEPDAGDASGLGSTHVEIDRRWCRDRMPPIGAFGPFREHWHVPKYVKLEPPVIWRKPARNQELHPVGSDRGEYKPEYYLKCAWKGSKINQFESRNRESSCMADLHICDVQSRGVRFRVFDDLL